MNAATRRSNHPRRCTARISDGSRRCRKWAVKGTNVCRAHGAAAPQVKRSARQRLDALAEPALTALSAALERVEQDPRIALHPTIARYALGVLDRCGFGPASRIEIDQRIEAESEAMAAALATTLRGVLGDLGHNVADARVARLVRRHLLRAVAGRNGHEPPPAPKPAQRPRKPTPAPARKAAPEPEPVPDEVTL